VEDLLDEPQNKGWVKRLALIIGAVTKERIGKSKLHLSEFLRCIRETANSNPPEPGDRVWVERYEHGWNVGYDKVCDRACHEGIWCFTVVLEETGSPIHIDHARDIRKIPAWY
jgi:hypothetical protein